MIESAGRDESDFADHKYSDSLPVEENRETMAGCTDRENIDCLQTVFELD